MLTVKSNNNQSRREMDRLDDHYQRIGTSERGWREIQLAKFESKILQSNREREFPARARVSGAWLVTRGKVGKLRSWTESGTE